MDWKDYKETPEDGMFEAIQRRLRVRRFWRIGGGVAVVALIAALVVAVLAPKANDTAEDMQQSRQVAQAPVVSNDVDVQETAATTPVSGDGQMSREVQDATTSNTLLPEAQMQVVTVAEPMEDVTAAATLAVPTVAPRQAGVTERRHATVAESQEEDTRQASGLVNSVEANPQAKFGGGETPAAYHEDNVLWAPNVIVPAADKQENRVFKVVATSALQDFRMNIYNRGGRQVFSTSDINAAWDATVGGMMVPQGAYVWVATFRDSEGVQRRETGTVTVVR